MKKCPKCESQHEKNGTFCSRKCANSRTYTDEYRSKMSESMSKYKKCTYIKTCPKCESQHEKDGTYCSRKCANSRSWSDEDKIKKSESMKIYKESCGKLGTSMTCSNTGCDNVFYRKPSKVRERNFCSVRCKTIYQNIINGKRSREVQKERKGKDKKSISEFKRDSNTKYYIYTLDYLGEIFYVGKTIDLKKRYKNHIRESKNKRTHKEKFIYSVLNKGESINISILDEVDFGFENDMEIYWISQLRSWGLKLLNYNKGGEGGDNWSGRNHKESTKEKLRKIMNEKILNGYKSIGPKGEDNGRSKLTSEQVIELRKMKEEGYSYGMLSKTFGIAKNTVRDIVKRKKWTHI